MIGAGVSRSINVPASPTLAKRTSINRLAFAVTTKPGISPRGNQAGKVGKNRPLSSTIGQDVGVSEILC